MLTPSAAGRRHGATETPSPWWGDKVAAGVQGKGRQREAVSGGCGGFGEWFWTGAAGLEERRRRGALHKASALLTTPAPYRHIGGKSQPGFLSFIHLAMVSCLAVVYQLNKLKTVWKRSPLNLACPETNRRGGRQGHAHPRPAQS